MRKKYNIVFPNTLFDSIGILLMFFEYFDDQHISCLEDNYSKTIKWHNTLHGG